MSCHSLMPLPAAIPTVTSITSSQVVTLGTNAVLTCVYNGNPSPSLGWLKNGEVVNASTKHTFFSVSSTTHTLTISNVQPADLTSYQCHPSNKRGSSVRETFLCGQRKDIVMEVIRHAELIVEWFLWTIEHTNRSLDNSNATFCLTKPVTGETLHLNYQVTCWCARSSKGTILLA